MFIHLPSPSDDKLIKDSDWEATAALAQHMLEAVDERPSLMQPLLVSQRDPDTVVFSYSHLGQELRLFSF